ncbi:ABC transporter permease [Streptomonospora salina]|uniref:Simple sugar transport system permease protein n=1 Tax=Streptomonospora salina TaxID=104205 RepID=A0A841E809_9ACTN|nr:ABC transporter permease [Streptomonospora salina]MBB5997258.1 simple sugar transport system permease protein [Streptomonospora salina]
MTSAQMRRLMWPLLVLAGLLAANVAATPGFFEISVQDGRLYGSVVDILHFGTPLLLISLGMTMVIALRGIDLSVGAVVAVSGALACEMIAAADDPGSPGTVAAAVAAALGASALLGLWNGFLVAVLRIQPIVATLILMIAGRGVAQLITGGQITTVRSEPYRLIAGGDVAAIPVTVVVAAATVLGMWLVVRRTALGLLIEAIGGNAEAGRLSGIRARGMSVAAYAFCGLCAGLAGILISANTGSADGNNAGLWIELDAILAVVIGGTMLSGGRFSIAGTVLGAVIVQTLSTTVYTMGVPPESSLVFKALVVFLVCLLQSPRFRAQLAAPIRRARPPRRAPADPGPRPSEEDDVTPADADTDDPGRQEVPR